MECFFTHEHADHTAGIKDDIRPFDFKQNANLCTSAGSDDNLKSRFAYVFEEP
jgi:phosphoribosyl 1,2-cyclic phosphate phosphodiesterase